MANGITVLDPNFLQRGLATQNAQAVEQAQAAAQPQPFPRVPTLFDQVQTGLFSTGANPVKAAELAERLTGPFAQGLFGKAGARKRTEFVRERQDAAIEGFVLQQESVGTEMTPGRLEIMNQFVESPQGLAGAQQFFAQERLQAEFNRPEAVVSREAALAAQEVQRSQARSTLAQSQQSLLESQTTFNELNTPRARQLRVLQQDAAIAAAQMGPGGNFGSGLSTQEFIQTRDKVARLQDGVDALMNLSDVVENFTPLQLRAAEGGQLIGKAEIWGFSVLGAMQSIIEDRQSILREGERDFFLEQLGNPTGFLTGIFTRDPRIMGQLQTLAENFAARRDASLVGFDQTTLEILSPVLTPGLRPYQTPEGVPRVAQPLPRTGAPGMLEQLGPIVQGLGRFGQMMQPGF